MSGVTSQGGLGIANNDTQFAEPNERILVIDGKQVLLRPMNLSQLSKLLQLIEPLMGEALSLFQSDPTLWDRLQKGAVGGEDLIDLAGLYGSHGDALNRAMAVLIHEPEDWVSKLLPDRGLALLLALVEINADFFGQALASMATKLSRPAAAEPAAAT